MVNPGGPSWGCKRCRQRKVKCDETKPACLRCQKSGLECTGYRNMQDIIFKDHFAATIPPTQPGKKRTASNASCFSLALTAASIPHQEKAAAAASQRIRFRAYTPPSTSPTLDSDDAAIGFFLSNYAYYETWYSRNYENWILKCIAKNGDLYRGLRAAVLAVGLASISNSSLAPAMSAKADRLYYQALRAVNIALNDRTLATRDETLLMVVVLGLFETVTSSERSKHYSWKSHIDGAAALLELRGPVRGEVGMQLYFQARPQILSLCVQYGIAVPKILAETTFDHDSVSGLSAEIPASHEMAGSLRMLECSIMLIDCKAELVAATTLADTLKVFEKAMNIEQRLKAWPSTLPPEWEPKISYVSDAVISWRYLYSTPYIRRTWGYWRMYRILINQAILHQSKSEPLKASALAQIRQFSVELCASSDIDDSGKKIAALSIFRPLYVVATESNNPIAIRRFAAKRLYAIGASAGLRRAQVIADLVIADLDEQSKEEPIVLMLANRPFLSF